MAYNTITIFMEEGVIMSEVTMCKELVTLITSFQTISLLYIKMY